MATSFKYDPLPSATSFRILKVWPSESEDTLECRLEVADVTNPPQYLALSYVWAEQPGKVSIICNGKRLEITRSLYNCLQNDGVRGEPHQPMPLWADGICIDQQNLAERSEQVKLMGDIYRNCMFVIVWLGSDTGNHAEAALAEIKSIADECADTVRKNDYSLAEYGSHLRVSPTSPKADEVKRRLSRCIEFFRRPWFRRVWVQQEVGLAPRSIVLWGSFSLDDDKTPLNWEDVGLSCMYMLRFWKHILHVLDMTQDVKRANEMYMTFSDDVKFRNYIHLLDNTRSYEATDPRDKVYALFAHQHFQYESGGTIMEPDYQKPFLDVYRDLALKNISFGKDLEILSAVQHDPSNRILDPSYPSWIPRWDIDYGIRMLGRFNCDDFAAGNNPPQIIDSPDPSVLIVRGIRFDTVCSLALKPMVASDLNVLPMADAPEFNIVGQLWSGYRFAGLEVPYPSGETFIQAYANTLTAHRYASPDGFDIMKDFRAYWHQVAWSDIPDSELSALDLLRKEANARAAEGGDWDRFREAAAEVCQGRTFFLTEKCYMGLGPGGMKVDTDEVWILFGADFPMVLRKQDSPDGKEGKYRLIGECYVQGIMQGQVVRSWRGQLPKNLGQPLQLNNWYGEAEGLDLVEVAIW
jgi:hypothetical protein